jgi:PAS domain S-box-containing protein
MRVRVLLAISLLFAALLAAALLLNAIVRQHDADQERQRALNFAQNFAAAYERVLGDQTSLLSAVIALPEAGIRHPTMCRAALAAVVGRHGALLNLATMDAQGRVLCAANGNTADFHIGAHPAFKRARATLGPALGTLVHVGESGRRAVLLALPMLDPDGALDALLVAFLDQHWLNERFAETVPDGVVLRILDEEGVFVVRQPNPECCLGRSGLHLSGIKEALASGQPHAGESLWLDDVVRLQADVPLKSPLSGVVSIGIPASLMQASANRTLLYATIGLLTLCLVLYALAWAGTQRYILGPMQVLAETVHRVRGGDLESRVPALPGHREFATLGADINAMTATLAERRQRIEDDLRRLREQEAQRRLAASVFEQAREAITITDADANILTVSRRFTEITGYAAEEVIGKNPRVLQSGRHDTAFYRAMWEALTGTGHWGGEIWNRRKDGTIYPEWLSISAVRDEEGRTTNYVAVFTDLTLRKQAEQALRESEARNRLILDTALDAVISMGPDGRVREWNSEAERMFGYTRLQAIGDKVSRLIVPPRHRRAHDEGLRHYLESGTGPVLGRRVEIEAMRADGSEFPVELAIATVENGEEKFFSAFIRDISERKAHELALKQMNEGLERRVRERTEALQTANQELEAFSYSVSHDLRAPLRAINGFSHLLEDEYAPSLDEKARNYLARVRAGSERMGLLIDDLLKLSQTSRQPMTVASADLSALAEEIAAELQAGEPQRPCEWVIAPGIRAMGDAGLLRAALHNLFGNAWKYSSKRDRPRIEFGMTEEQGRPAYFVRDNGAGFDMAHAGRLFGAFQRLHSPSEFPGTGIGLATVARIIHRHGGKIWAESAPDKGATFRFTLHPIDADQESGRPV